MSLEDALASLQNAIEENTAALRGKKGGPTPDAEEAAPKKRRGKKEPDPVTVDEVREALMALNEAKGKQAVVDLLAEYGVKKIGDLAEESYAECKTAAEERAAAEEGSDDGELFE